MFNICFARQASLPFFQEIGELLFHSLQDLGHAPTCTTGLLLESRYNILLDYHRLGYDPALARYHVIPYQLEQLSDAHRPLDQDALAILGQADRVWDYARENIDALAAKGIAADQLPVGHHPRLARIPDQAAKDVDVLFYGTLNTRRERLLDGLARSGIGLRVLQGVFGADRDAWIARSRIVLNIHYYPMKIMEVARLGYLLNNQACVLTEDSPINPLRRVGIMAVGYEKIVATCLRLLENEAARLAQARKNAQLFARFYPMPALLRRLTDALPALSPASPSPAI